MSVQKNGARKLFWGITWNILIAGIVSFFMDVSSEMAYAVGPLFLTALGTTPAVLGLIEGIAEATAAVFKYFSGAIGDRFQRYKPLVTIGYFISALSRPLMAICPSCVPVTSPDRSALPNWIATLCSVTVTVSLLSPTFSDSVPSVRNSACVTCIFSTDNALKPGAVIDSL